jgi:hypothetical protein
MENRNNGGGNGQNGDRALSALEDIGEEVSIDGLDGAFRTPTQTDTTRLLMLPGSDVQALLMRSDIPSNQLLMAIVCCYQDCIEHGYHEGAALMSFLLAGLPARRGRRANMVSETIIGERSSGGREGKNLFRKMSGWAFPEKE